MNLGLAIGGYAMTLPFATPGIPGAAVAVWFDRFFLPGFVSVTTLGLTTLIFGFRGFRASRNQYASRTALLGLLFSVVHFGFGNSVCMSNLLLFRGLLFQWHCIVMMFAIHSISYD